jgi:hypothetical protein
MAAPARTPTRKPPAKGKAVPKKRASQTAKKGSGLSKKVGGIPLWVILAGVAAAVGVGLYIRHKNKGATAPTTDPNATTPTDPGGASGGGGGSGTDFGPLVDAIGTESAAITALIGVLGAPQAKGGGSGGGGGGNGGGSSSGSNSNDTTPTAPGPVAPTTKPPVTPDSIRLGSLPTPTSSQLTHALSTVKPPASGSINLGGLLNAVTVDRATPAAIHVTTPTAIAHPAVKAALSTVKVPAPAPTSGHKPLL